jgi:hypothetical protein
VKRLTRQQFIQPPGDLFSKRWQYLVTYHWKTMVPASMAAKRTL